MSSPLPVLPNIYYTEEEAQILQGDILVDPGLDLSELTDESDVSALAILNSSCDLVQSKIDNVQLSPVRQVDRLVQSWVASNEKHERATNYLDSLFRNNVLNSFFLPPTERFGGNRPHYIDLQLVLTLPFDQPFKTRALGHRVASLRSPSRERLAHTLGQYFSRVGVPRDQEVPKSHSLAWGEQMLEPLRP